MVPCAPLRDCSLKMTFPIRRFFRMILSTTAWVWTSSNVPMRLYRHLPETTIFVVFAPLVLTKPSWKFVPGVCELRCYTVVVYSSTAAVWLLIVLDIVSNVSIDRNIEVSMYRIQRVLSFIPWHPRVLYAGTQPFFRCCQNTENRIHSFFLGSVRIVPNSILVRYPTLNTIRFVLFSPKYSGACDT